MVSVLLMGTTFFALAETAAIEQEVPTGFELYEEHFNAGNLSERGYLYEGKPVGEWQRFHENGQVSMDALFKADGSPAGSWIYYDETGKKIKEELYEDGQLVNTVEFD
ncbi:hypothetical protein MMG00_03570 [Ignatzschineria rhizosphaerae]|uniref:Uncharacterized protein n=1 Tax=Ignatzschineria rhizosphaerae TaxID=2923279 RepID=A0ABY3X237_9GAMM|nr:hypothetical protein [Ignatzschineria rhizosphaerae]UNM96942.1 hypothetical protein MMG00_03570 [Ignatzschineria rhizosphaerae]